jgi:hypothetical protein
MCASRLSTAASVTWWRWQLAGELGYLALQQRQQQVGAAGGSPPQRGALVAAASGCGCGLVEPLLQLLLLQDQLL